MASFLGLELILLPFPELFYAYSDLFDKVETRSVLCNQEMVLLAIYRGSMWCVMFCKKKCFA